MLFLPEASLQTHRQLEEKAIAQASGYLDLGHVISERSPDAPEPPWPSGRVKMVLSSSQASREALMK